MSTQIAQQMIGQTEGTLDVEQYTPEEKEALLATLGSQIIETAVARYISDKDELTQTTFISWFEEHASEADVLEQAIVLYPDFLKILDEEIVAAREHIALQ
jgi:hypothetical protein